MSRRFVLILGVGAALLLAFPAAGNAANIALYCKPGKFCTAIAKERGQIHLRLLLQTSGSKYKLCVTPPEDSGAERSCKTFRARRIGGVLGSDVRWARHFPSEGSGNYKVRWSKGGRRLGKTLTFSRN